MTKIVKLICSITVVFILSCTFVFWVRSDMPDYPQDRRYVYEGNNYRISSPRKIDEAILDEMSQSITIRDEKQIEQGKIFLPELELPGNVPEGYQFESLIITKYLSSRWEYSYIYREILGSGMLFISQKEGKAIDISWTETQEKSL